MQKKDKYNEVRCVNCESVVSLDKCVLHNELVFCDSICKKEYEHLVSIGEISEIII